jgi:hypothetical protein
MQVNLRAGPGSSLSVICCYAPTAQATEAEREVFYAELDTLLDNIPPDKVYSVCEDFNATLTERLSHVNFLREDTDNRANEHGNFLADHA